MILRDNYYYPYDPAPAIQAYEPVLTELSCEVRALHEVWHRLAPVWKRELEKIMADEGLEVTDHRVYYNGYGITLIDSPDCFSFSVTGRSFGPRHLLWLLAHVVRTPEDMERLVTGVKEVILRVQRALERLQQKAERTWAHLTPEERKITP